jgi:UDP-N-acetylglucosamine 2-epimerase (non-hydrolysing)
MSLLDKYTDHKIVHTGQNWDYELNEIFFKDLRVRKPDYFLGVDTTTLGTVYGNVLIEIEKVLDKERPEAVLILGDTNSSIAGIIAKRKKIPIYHMEAGNRCFDFNVPEEINRRIIDHISDFNLVYTEHARRNLLAEGLPPRRIYVTGSPMTEVLRANMEHIQHSRALVEMGLLPQKYFLASIHREENVDNRENLLSLIKAFRDVSQEFGSPVVVSTHPRTRKRLASLSQKFDNNIQFLKPFGFFDYVHLQMNATCVLSDSGTISEEASILGFPAVTVRNSMERPEAMDCGGIIITGLKSEPILAAIKMQISPENKQNRGQIPQEYQVKDVSLRVVKLIIGTAGISNLWDNIRLNDIS